MTPSRKVRIEIEGRETIETADEQILSEILKSPHPNGSSRVIIHAGDGEWLSAFGSVGEGFSIAYCRAGQTRYVYCPVRLSFAEANTLYLGFIEGDPDWYGRIHWKQQIPMVDTIIKVIVILVIAYIAISFFTDISHDISLWFSHK